jgi:hypothetical protein
MLLRGAHRSAIVEASAAFDLCLVRKIHAGLLSKGKTDLEIDRLLEENPKYEERAKKWSSKQPGSLHPS